ncbi:NAD+ synthase [Microthyrium microscopicum]|uniref:Glutamine-dependent NAD(+) synthetase n=1 Tax=Microthyrium microscopicum TaxID=703497 RepID=A0A6A6UJS0_9PEZI|nr:NAD+ synthase [Microthyrium microscopicum]
MSYITVAAATLPSIALDFRGNRDRILESIRIAKAQGARLRTGPELEISGYGCLDHFLEADTVQDSIQMLTEIISDPICQDMVIDLGLPMRHRNTLYNCRVLATFKHIYFIRPKQSLANDGLYRETRHFTAWAVEKHRIFEDYYLEHGLREATGQRTVPFGDGILSTLDTAIGCESCEELFTPLNPSSYMGLNGCEIILNSSASHAELRKLNTRIDLIANCTRKLGGIYVYANATGVDSEARQMYDGSSLIFVNGKILNQGSQFSLKPVEVTIATIDIEAVRTKRPADSARSVQASHQTDYPRVECNLKLSRTAREIYLSKTLTVTKEIQAQILHPMEEIWLAESVFLWQYLCRSSAGGFFLALSGGLDSCTVACFIFGMAKFVLQSIQAGETTTLNELRRITGVKDLQPTKPEEITSLLLHTAYMGTVNSSEETRSRARDLSKIIGAYHSDLTIDEVITAHEAIIKQGLGFIPKYSVEGGSAAESLAKQNIQARNRMVISYEYAQLSTTARKLPRAGASLLVVTSGNVDENLRGYVTKYDASSGDIAPLGSISKNDAKDFLRWACAKWDLPILNKFIDATPTAELLPLSAGVQDDESDSEMGISYSDLQVYGILRKVEKLGAFSSYLRLLGDWKERPGHTPSVIAEKTIKFFRYYCINRHKSTIMTPSIHMSGYNPDDNRHDLRPFLYPSMEYQFNKIRKHAESLETAQEAGSEDDSEVD